ncbi:hypothetical protein ACP70R_023833 [Stipagrostis hirtigluma subsp. patula]
MAAKPVFTDSFPVDSKSDNYGDFIRLVRQHVIKYCSDKRPGIDQPVLPPEEPKPKQWFHIILSTKATRSLTLAIRMDNLYLEGFKTPAGVWWEFSRKGDVHLIDGSKFLGFGGGYPELLGGKGLDTVKLGRVEMTEAVDFLGRHTATAAMPSADPYGELKSRLVKLVIIISEGLRFYTVQGTVADKFDDVGSVRLTQIQGQQVNDWKDICEAVFKWAVNPTAKPSTEMEKIGVKDKKDAAKIVALVKDVKDKN